MNVVRGSISHCRTSAWLVALSSSPDPMIAPAKIRSVRCHAKSRDAFADRLESRLSQTVPTESLKQQGEHHDRGSQHAAFLRRFLRIRVVIAQLEQCVLE